MCAPGLCAEGESRHVLDPSPPVAKGLYRQTRHFTQLDQVTQLVVARDADPDLGFMARLLALELKKIKKRLAGPALPGGQGGAAAFPLAAGRSRRRSCASSNSPQRQGPTSCIRRLVRVSALSSSAPEM